ncbi:26S proteasome regulatory subunit 4 homolog [Benincasa hispida]|uniref:26S proteasome regulatory subunit 4 homolog n=1 Tax=Benincasa hispida TaxID=102211 RepID=UPI0019021871|nr:26S proteasome regulatory subunit 4 homolog [Benincasa hispida]
MSKVKGPVHGGYFSDRHLLEGLVEILRKSVVSVSDSYSLRAHSGGECEIRRTMLELLNQLDGFDSRGDVKVILATNRIESADPALLRPGRIDRKIEFPLPEIHTSRMTLADDVNLEEFVMTKDEFSGADIEAICIEAGLLALRERHMKVTHADFKKAKEEIM